MCKSACPIVKTVLVRCTASFISDPKHILQLAVATLFVERKPDPGGHSLQDDWLELLHVSAGRDHSPCSSLADVRIWESFTCHHTVASTSPFWPEWLDQRLSAHRPHSVVVCKEFVMPNQTRSRFGHHFVASICAQLLVTQEKDPGLSQIAENA